MLTEFGIKIAPSTYYAALARPKSRREIEDEKLLEDIRRVYDENYRVYGARKVWHQLRRDGIRVGRGRVERLMRRLGLAGAVRGKTVRTTVPDPGGVRAVDLVKRQFAAGAPNRLWVADFTYVATWAGTVYVAFVIDVFSRTIVGWRASTSKEPTWSSTPSTWDCSTASIGTVGDALDNALAESAIGLYKAELIKPKGPWHTLREVETATNTWVEWYNNRRLHEVCGYRPPTEFETLYELGDLTSLVA